MQAIDAEGAVVSEPSTLLQVGENYFSSLYNQQSLPATLNTLPCIPHTLTIFLTARNSIYPFHLLK